MKIEEAAAAGIVPPYGMGRIIRSVRTPHGTQDAWQYDADPGAQPMAWITYDNGRRVRLWGSIELVRSVIEGEARNCMRPATIGWEVADV